ncbi:hypothetical protein ACKWTF_000535 [Chironomus riparius]
MFRINTFALTLSISSILLINGQRIEYLNGLLEDQLCTLDSGSYGRCRKISDCAADFEIHRRDKTVLKVCSFASHAQSHVICCSQHLDSNSQLSIGEQTTKLYSTMRPSLITRTDQTTTRTDRTTTFIDQTTQRIVRTTTRPIRTTTTERTSTKIYQTTPRITQTTTEPYLNFREDQDEVFDIKNDPNRYEISTTEQINKNIDLIDVDSCQDELLKYRIQWINTNHFGKAMADKIIPLNKENCDFLTELNQQSGTTTQNFYSCRLARGRYFIINNSKRRPEVPKVREGFRPNMAAIGWTDKIGGITYRCFGSIVTEKFIVTAAHCQDLDDLRPNTVRVGDRYLMSRKDDENAQQLKIQEFTVHTNYKPTLDYNDIAMIETVERIVFNNFVVPSCIGNLYNSNENENTVSGYGDDDDGSLMNVLMEMNVEVIDNSECNKVYGKDQQLPWGIIDSQICVRSKATRKEINETCFGESGSPLQFKSSHDIKEDDYGSDYISTTYETSTIIGIQSFSTSCAFDIPSVYTRLESYTDWMRSVIEKSI